MTNLELAIFMIVLLIILMAFRLPIALAMLVVGGIGYVNLAGFDQLLNYLSTAPYSKFSTYDLSVVPMFILMGELATRAGITRELFQTCNTWIGHLKGGIAMASVAGCAAFGSISGSSLATASTMGRVALPEMRRHHYSGSLASGTLAAGGTLGILIPPSLVLIIYSVLTEQNIASMFIAAFVPGILAALGYMLTISIYVRLKPESGPAGEKSSFAEKIRSLRDVWHVTLIFIIVLGGIYSGIFTPTESAAIGMFLTAILAYFHGKLRWEGFKKSVLKTASISAMIFFIIFGADLFNVFIALSQLPAESVKLLNDSDLSPYTVLTIILISYLLLGCIMDSVSMILLSIPIYFPIIMGMDFGMSAADTAIWFGILALIVVEVGLITPPVGMNVFIINSLDKSLTLAESFRGVTPFLISDIIRVIILVLFPQITLFLLHWLN
ncbi:MAG: TRAP transporter large permease [Gammaproteobacteria bacterium]|nr:TRAP transporter large permease [Gammaproteobacteria bacterium]